MRKLDSFLKEAQRIHGSSSNFFAIQIHNMCWPFAPASLTRMAIKDFVFSDGSRVPKGTLISAVMAPRQLDDKVYPDATTFKGFRFSDMREEEGEDVKNQMVATSADYLNFGHGKHAWWVKRLCVEWLGPCMLIVQWHRHQKNSPGRFFAVNELKAMMAHLVVTYDFMINEIPKPLQFGIFKAPNPMGEVLFRKRRV
jgi:Cytochrome P450